jgi:hypothetical protein
MIPANASRPKVSSFMVIGSIVLALIFSRPLSATDTTRTRAEFNYQAREIDELSFVKNEVLHVYPQAVEVSAKCICVST